MTSRLRPARPRAGPPPSRSPRAAARQGCAALEAIARAVHRLGHGLVLHDVLLAAPAMAFHFFLSLLPLLVFLGYVIGLIARRRGVDAVLSPLLDNLPGTAESLVKKEVERLAGGTGTGTALGPVAAATFLWIASGGTHGLMNAVENVIGAPRVRGGRSACCRSRGSSRPSVRSRSPRSRSCSGTPSCIRASSVHPHRRSRRPRPIRSARAWQSCRRARATSRRAARARTVRARSGPILLHPRRRVADVSKSS